MVSVAHAIPNGRKSMGYYAEEHLFPHLSIFNCQSSSAKRLHENYPMYVGITPAVILHWVLCCQPQLLWVYECNFLFPPEDTISQPDSHILPNRAFSPLHKILWGPWGRETIQLAQSVVTQSLYSDLTRVHEPCEEGYVIQLIHSGLNSQQLLSPYTLINLEAKMTLSDADWELHYRDTCPYMLIVALPPKLRNTV